MWLVMAVLSAFFAGVTSILAKCGIKKTDSDVATAIRTIIVLLFSWIMVFIVGSYEQITEIETKSLLFLILSGFATGASWICYFKALSMGDVNKVVPIDKSSTILSVLLAIICFNEIEHLSVKLCSTIVLSVGIFMMVEKKQTEEKEVNGKVDALCCPFRCVCRINFYSRKSGNYGGGIKPRYGIADWSCTFDGMGYCFFERQTKTNARN